jgi:hypothetical protein
MKQIIIRKLTCLIFMIGVLATSGCIKDTYNMNKISDKIHLSPTVGLSAVTGGVSLRDIIKPNDTVRIDQNKFVKIVFKQDTIFSLKMADVYKLTNMVAFTKSYVVGELSIDPFSKTLTVPLSQIVSAISNPTIRNNINSLNNTTGIFPAFPTTTLPDMAFPVISNVESAVFSTGTIDITITNNLPTSISGVSIQLFNSVGHTSIGAKQTLTSIAAGGQGFASISLVNQTVKNSVVAAISFTGDGSGSNSVPVNLTNNKITVLIAGSNLKVKSGRVTLPGNSLTSLNNSGTIAFTPGSDVEIDKIKITTGNFTYKITKPSALLGKMTLVLPTAMRNGTTVSNQIDMVAGTTVNGNISFNNSIINLGSDPLQPFNKIPYSISVSTTGMIDFNSTDVVKVDFSLPSPVFNYVKGYFGQVPQKISPDSTDLGIADILSHLKGSFLISSPLIRINYSNSFAIPFKFSFDAKGKRKGFSDVKFKVDTLINSPVDTITRVAKGSIRIDKNNSTLPALISMLPEGISYSGTAVMNPSVNPLGVHPRNNYVFNDSRFIIDSLEVEVPLELRINNLQFTDTVSNFLKDTGGSGSSSVNVSKFKLLRVNMNVKNGFPLGLSVKLILYDSVTKKEKGNIGDASKLLGPAPAGADGKATGFTETTTILDLTNDFFTSIDLADKVIIQFTLNTTDSATKDVKFYSDYRIDFKASVVVQPDITLK